MTIGVAASYRRQMLRTLLLGCAFVGAIASVGGAAGGGTGWPQPDARDKALLASVLHGMRTDLRTVRLTQLAAGWRKGRPQGTLQLVTTTSVSGKDHARSLRADWDTLLIAHGYNERCVRNADHCLAVYEGPDDGSGAGRSGAHKPYWSAHVLARAIRHAFAAAGLRVTSISFEHPHAFAPVVMVRSSHPRRAWNAYWRKARLAIVPALRHAEGRLIQMFDAHGRLFYVGAGSGNTGMAWCAPMLHCPHL